MFDLLFDPNAWVAFATLTVLEVVLGIDNIIFISVLVSSCPTTKPSRRGRSASAWRWSSASCCCWS